MHQKKGFKYVWLSLLLITSIIFLVVGIVMLFVDHSYNGSSKYLITSVIYFSSFVLIIKNRIKHDYANPIIGLGFVFSVIGLTNAAFISLNIWIWIFGIFIFIYGLISNNVMKSFD
ncbi:MAG: hypothetical protein KKF62_00365 [Bacteroidetes bacterium]|nr:hypothetical protein [Bacteroidota bacterium]MBU1114593.1 hypothetical protein [Bacteroidota bacterium]MBU1799631.1 hypothetical protein [Bacteroidota bacterium]